MIERAKTSIAEPHAFYERKYEAEQPIAPQGKKRRFARHRFALVGILLISAVKTF